MNGRKTFNKTIRRNLFLNLERVEGYNPSIWRYDIHGNLVCFPSYGDRNSSYGWDIHHIDGNKDNNRLSNLVAVHYDTHLSIHGR